MDSNTPAMGNMPHSASGRWNENSLLNISQDVPIHAHLESVNLKHNKRRFPPSMANFVCLFNGPRATSSLGTTVATDDGCKGSIPLHQWSYGVEEDNRLFSVTGHLENLSVQWCLNKATVRSGRQVHITQVSGCPCPCHTDTHMEDDWKCATGYRYH